MKTRNEREGRRPLRGLGVLVAGASLGGAIALLLAPRSGEKVRHAIGRRYRKAKRKISRRANDLRDGAAYLLEHSHGLRERGLGLIHGGLGGKAVRRRA